MSDSKLIRDRKHLRRELGEWSLVQNDHSITLGDIHEILEEALNDSDRFMDQRASEVIDEFEEPLATWFELWDCSPDSERMVQTVEYSQANLEEDMCDVEDLIEELGPSFRFADL